MTQKTHRIVLAIGLNLTLLGINGCALFMPTPEDPLANDPVARAALAVRDEGRSPANFGSESGGSGDSGFIKERSAPMFNRLTLGMEMPQVLELWGKPTDVKAAGEPSDGNQRWVYSEGVAGLYGLGTNRVIYFEQGRVAGWESH